MQVQPRNLKKHLKTKSVSPVWLVSGEEHLLVQEALDLLRTFFREQGVTERKVFYIENRFEWQALNQNAGTASLFATKRLFELRFSKATLNKSALSALLSLCASASANDLSVIITMPKLDSSKTRTKWYKQLTEHAAHVPVWPISLKEIPGWLAERVKSAGLRLDAQAMHALLERVEGNLLAASQEIVKLTLLDSNQTWDAESILAAVGDSSRYNVFDLVDSILAGRTMVALKILRSLEQEGEYPLRILSVLRNEFVSLQKMCREVEQGLSPSQVARQHTVFRARIPLVEKALQRLTKTQCEAALARLAWVDQSVKGLILSNPWELMRNLIIGFTQPRKNFAQLDKASQSLVWLFN